MQTLYYVIYKKSDVFLHIEKKVDFRDKFI